MFRSAARTSQASLRRSLAVAAVAARAGERGPAFAALAPLPLAAAQRRGYAVDTTMAQREELTRVYTKVKDEAKGQTLDLNEMGDAARASLRSLQELQKRQPNLELQNASYKGKAQTLQASLKAYAARVQNLQNEARGIQNDVDALLRLVWGTTTATAMGPDATKTAATPEATAAPTKPAASATASSATAEEDVTFEVPPIAQRLQQINDEVPKPQPVVETVEGEVVREAPAASSGGNAAPDVIEVEAVESPSSSSSASSATTNDPDDVSAAADISVTEITRELHEKGIDFSDCLDARTLRRRYLDVKSGKIRSASSSAATSAKPQSSFSSSSSSSSYGTPQSQANPPPRSSGGGSSQSYHTDASYEQYKQQQGKPNTTETGIMPDPHPGGQRKMVDPMKYIWEVKAELARENNVAPDKIDLWCQKIKLDDSKRLYEYSVVQGAAIEIRSKGDIPK